MIPVTPAPEPPVFNVMVRQPGLQWLVNNGIPSGQPPPDPAVLPPFWRKTSKELWTAYSGVCAYLCIYMEWPLGAHSTDHFVAKSRDAGQAYEWLNYRLSCLGANRNKNRFDDILDPFTLQPDTFVLNFASGAIHPNRAMPPNVQDDAQKTIDRLGLDEQECREMRLQHYGDYVNHDLSGAHLKRESPFVWHEANRQGLL